MYSMNKVSSLAHALPASRSSPFCTKPVFCTWVCQQAESRSLQVLSSRAALAAYSQNFLAGHKTHIQQEDVSKPLRLIISQEKKKEDETWLNSQRQEDSYWWGGHTWDMNCSQFNSAVCSTPWRQAVCWGSLLAIQQRFLLNPCHCASSSLLHSCEHCIDPRTQYYFTSILDRVSN